MKAWRASLPWFPFAESSGGLFSAHTSHVNQIGSGSNLEALSLPMSHSEILRVWDLNMELGIRGLDQSLTLGDGSKGQ